MDDKKQIFTEVYLSEDRCENGSQSPCKGRSLREFDEELNNLRKENFNLKLRIFFLEENSSKGYDDDKRNIDLKIENEELKKDLQAKQILLCEAAKAIEGIANQTEIFRPNLDEMDTKETRIIALEAILKSKENYIEQILIEHQIANQTLEERQKNVIENQKQIIQVLEKQLAQYENKDTMQDLKEKLIAKSRAHEKGCKTIQLLLMKTRELDAQMEMLKTEIKGNTDEQTEFQRLNAEIVQGKIWHQNCFKMCNQLKVRLHELAGFLNFLLKHKGVLDILAYDQHIDIRQAIESTDWIDSTENVFINNCSPTNHCSTLAVSSKKDEDKNKSNNFLSQCEDDIEDKSFILEIIRNESKHVKVFRETIFHKFMDTLEMIRKEIISKKLVPRKYMENKINEKEIILQNLTLQISKAVLERTKFMKERDCMEETNRELKEKLERTKRAFEKTWAQLRNANQRKEKIERDIRQTIFTTHSVLKNARSNIEQMSAENNT